MADKIVELSRGLETANGYGECKRLVEAMGVKRGEFGGLGKSYAAPMRSLGRFSQAVSGFDSPCSAVAIGTGAMLAKAGRTANRIATCASVVSVLNHQGGPVAAGSSLVGSWGGIVRRWRSVPRPHDGQRLISMPVTRSIIA